MCMYVNVQPNPMDLLQLASAYHLPLLFAACQTPIAAHIDIHNAVEVLDIARILQAKDLADACLTCISFEWHSQAFVNQPPALSNIFFISSLSILYRLRTDYRSIL